MFYLIDNTGIRKCWDTGDAFMVDTQTIYNEILGVSFYRDGRLNKQWITSKCLSGEWDIRSGDWLDA